jgi:methyl-accepting chemotaxis protein
VVADEVRTLASRTQESTEEIQRIIAELQQGSRAATEAMQSSYDYVLTSENEAAKAADLLGEVSDAIDQMNRMSEDIAAATREQASATQSIQQNINDIQSAVAQTGERLASNTQNNQHIVMKASQLHALVSAFKVN